MPGPGKDWYHLIFNTRGSWLPGDPRGFRSRNHRKHSDGDYNSPPPAGQHAGLHKLIRGKSKPAVTLPADLFETIGQAALDKSASQGHRILAIAVDAHHVHVLAELPDDRLAVKRIVGSWKQRASHKVRERLPGEVWSKSCDPVQVKDPVHHRQVFEYIPAHAQQGAWVWSYKEDAEHE
ncbi:transposase [Phycisphaeraceae bacterium D3-23]